MEKNTQNVSNERTFFRFGRALPNENQQNV